MSVSSGATLTATSLRQGNLAISGTAIVRASGQLSAVSRATSITFGASGKLNLNDNKLITSVAAGTYNGTAYTGVAGLIASGRNGNSLPLGDGASGIVTSQLDATGGNFPPLPSRRRRTSGRQPPPPPPTRPVKPSREPIRSSCTPTAATQRLTARLTSMTTSELIPGPLRP